MAVRSEPIDLSDSLSKILPIARTPEAIEYAFKKVSLYLKNHNLLDKAEALISLLEQHVKHIGYQFRASKAWSGEPVESSEYKRLHAAIAEEEAQDLRPLDSTVSDIEYGFSIDDKAHFLRAYTQAEGDLSSEKRASLDKLFNAWLASNDLVNKDGIISTADDMGKPIEQVKADEFKKLLHDSKSGYCTYLKERGIELNVVEHTAAPTDSEIVEIDRAIGELEALAAQSEQTPPSTRKRKHQEVAKGDESAASKSKRT